MARVKLWTKTVSSKLIESLIFVLVKFEFGSHSSSVVKFREVKNNFKSKYLIAIYNPEI